VPLTHTQLLPLLTAYVIAIAMGLLKLSIGGLETKSEKRQGFMLEPIFLGSASWS
jgi:hypothetical protein